MATTQNTLESFKEKKKFYEDKIMEIEDGSWFKNTELKIKKEKLEKWRVILDTLNWLVEERNEKASNISRLITSWKDLSKAKSELDAVDKINEKIQEAKNTLKSIEINSEKISWNIASVLWEDLSKESIEVAIINFDEEIEKANTEILENEMNTERSEAEKWKYKRLIDYVDWYLNWSRTKVDKWNNKSLKSDIVYKYADENGKKEIKDKIESRELSLEEYEDQLIEVNPIYAFIVHKIDSALQPINDDTEYKEAYKYLVSLVDKALDPNEEKEYKTAHEYVKKITDKAIAASKDNNKYATVIKNYYNLLEKFEKWTLSEGEKQQLENDCNLWLSLRESWDKNNIKDDSETIEDKKGIVDNEKEQEDITTDEDDRKFKGEEDTENLQLVKDEPEDINKNTSTENKIEELDIDKYISGIKKLNQYPVNQRGKVFEEIEKKFKLIKDYDKKIEFINRLSDRWFKWYISHCKIFQEVLWKEKDKSTESQTYWVFKTKKEYEQFLKEWSNGSEFALKLINEWKVKFVVENLKSFKWLNEEVLNGIIEETWSVNRVFENISSFSIEINKLLIILLDSWVDWSTIKNNIWKRNDLNSELACKLIDKWYYKSFQSILEKWCFEKLGLDVITQLINIKDVESQLMNTKYWITYIINHPEFFEVDELVDNIKFWKSIEDFIKIREYSTVIEILKNVELKDKEKYAIMLIEKWEEKDDKGWTWVWLLALSLNKINWLDRSIIANKFVELGKISELWNNLSFFWNLEYDIWLKLIKNDKSEQVAKCLKCFKEEDQGKLFIELLKESSSWNCIVSSIENYRKYMSDNEIASNLIKNNIWYILEKKDALVKFKGLKTEVAKYIINRANSKIRRIAWYVSENIWSFDKECHKDIMKLLVENWYTWYVIMYLEDFKWLKEEDYIWIANKAIESDYFDLFMLNLDKFKLKTDAQKNIVIKILEKPDWLDHIYMNIWKFGKLPDKWIDNIVYARETWSEIIINWTKDLTVKAKELKDFSLFEETDIVEYFNDKRISVNAILNNIDKIDKKYHKEIISRSLIRDINALSIWCNKIPLNEWNEKYNYLDAEIIELIDVLKKTENINNWWFIIGNIEKFNINNKRDILKKAIIECWELDIDQIVIDKLDTLITVAWWKRDLAECLIKNNHWEFVANNFHKFNFNNKEIIVRLLMNNWYQKSLAKNFSNLAGVDRRSLSERLKAEWYWDDIVNEESILKYNDIVKLIDEDWKFPKLALTSLTKEEKDKLGNLLIEKWKWNELAKNLWSFEKQFDLTIANELIERWKYREVASNPFAFKEKFNSELTKKLIENWAKKVVADNIGYFEWLNTSIARIAIDKNIWSYTKIILNIKNFDEEFHNEIADLLLNYTRCYWLFVEHINEFKWLDLDKVAIKLIENYHWYSVIENIQLFKSVDKEIIVEKLIDNWYSDMLTKNIDKFKWISMRKLAEKLLENWEYQVILKYFEDFRPKLGEKNRSILEMISEEQWKEISENLNDYRWLNPVLAYKIIMHGNPESIANYPWVFNWKIKESVTNELISQWFIDKIVKYPECYEWLDYFVALRIENREKVVNNIKSFKRSDHVIIAKYLIYNWFWKLLAEKLWEFKLTEEERDTIVSLLIKCWYWETLAKYNEDGYEKVKEELAKNLREFLIEYPSINKGSFKENNEEFRNKFKEKYQSSLFPKNWSTLIEILWGKPWCDTVWYLKELLTSKEAWDKYYNKYINKKKEEKQVKTEKLELPIKETKEVKEELSIVSMIKESLAKDFEIDEVFSNLITEENQWVLDIEEVEKAYKEFKKKNKKDADTLESICWALKQSWVEINESSWLKEDRDVKEEFSKGNLWRIQNFLWVNGTAWDEFKAIINDNWEIESDLLYKWTKANKVTIYDEFEKRLSHFWVNIINNDNVLDEFDEAIEKPNDFASKMEKFWYNFKNRKNFLENLEQAFRDDVKIAKSLEGLLKKIYMFKKTWDENYNPVEFIDSKTKKNKDFHVMKIRTTLNQPRIILEQNTNNILAIVTHNDYMSIWWREWRVILLKGIENRKHWFKN